MITVIIKMIIYDEIIEQGRPWECPHCPAAFVRKPYLEIHLRLVRYARDEQV